MNNNVDEISMSVNKKLLEDIATSIALSFVSGNLKEMLIEEIILQIGKEIRDGVQKIKNDILEEVTEKIHLSNDYKKHDQLKQKLRSDLKSDLKDFIEEKMYPEIKKVATQKISVSIASDIKNNLSKEFSQELLDKYKNEMTLFFIDDLKKSLCKNTATVEMKPVIIDKSFELSKDESLPIEICLLDKVYKYKLDSGIMGSPSGIYFLYRKRELQYVGQSICVSQRIPSHINQKDFDEAFFIPIRIDQLNYVETFFITKYQPPLNRHKGSVDHRDLNNPPSFIFSNEPLPQILTA